MERHRLSTWWGVTCLIVVVGLFQAGRLHAQSPGVLYTWAGTGDTLNWFKNFGTNDVTISNDTAGQLTVTETGDPGTGVAISDGFNTISEAAAAFDAGGIDLTGLTALQFLMGHNGSAPVNVQFFVQASPASTFVALGSDVAVSPGLNTYVLALGTLTAGELAYIRTIGMNIRDHVDEGNLTWTIEEVASVGAALRNRDFATHNPGSSDGGLQGAIVNFDNGAVDGNDGGQNQTGLMHNVSGSPPGNSGSLRWVDLPGQGGAAVSYANGTVFQGNTFNERPTDMSNYGYVTARIAATPVNGAGGAQTIGVQYFLQTGNFSFHAAGNAQLPADGQFHELTFSLDGIPDLNVVMQHGLNLGDHEGALTIDVDNVRASLFPPVAGAVPAFSVPGLSVLMVLLLAAGCIALRLRQTKPEAA